MPSRAPLVWSAAAMLSLIGAASGFAEEERLDNIGQVQARLHSCWRPPSAASATPGIDITVLVSFNRSGDIIGHPRITYESERATDSDRLRYRIAVMEALQRCTPLPFTDGMAGAVAGRPFAIQFRNRRPSPKPVEKRAWLTPKIR